MNRYQQLEDNAYAGLGADELGTMRLTRPCERTEHAQAVLDRKADAAWDAMDQARGTDQFEQLRDAALAAKDAADNHARATRKPPAHPTKNVTEGIESIPTRGLNS